MDRRKVVFLTGAIVLAAAAVFVYFEADLSHRTQQTAQESSNLQTADGSETAGFREGTGEGGTDGGMTGDSPGGTPTRTIEAAAGDPEENLICREKVETGYNTPEYELELELCENSDNRTFIRMQYYLNGSTVVNELDEGDLPELAGIFENRAKESGGSKAYRIGQALLNPVHSQLYLLIHSAPFGAYMQSSFYLIQLNDMSIKKLFSYPGLYGTMTFNRDFSLLAWSFGDPPVMSVYQEDNLLEVFDCANGDYLVRGNVHSNGKTIGANSSPGYLHDYEFIAWKSVDVLKLKQAVRPLRDPDSGLTQNEILYDIKRNLLLNPDGSELKGPVMPEDGNSGEAAGGSGRDSGEAAPGSDAQAGGAADPAAPAQEKADSEPVKALKSFYSFLGSEEDYPKAMKLLDDSFKLRLEMLKQFGTDEIVKSDIDAGSASVYSELLKAARLDAVTGEETKEGASTIQYTQLMELGNGAQFEQAMSAQLKQFGKDWKIILIEDGVQ